MDWQARALAAEQALQVARRGIRISDGRKAVLQALGDLKPGEWLDTQQLAQRTAMAVPAVHDIAVKMAAIGLVERPENRGGGRGNLARFRLGYLVQVPE